MLGSTLMRLHGIALEGLPHLPPLELRQAPRLAQLTLELAHPLAVRGHRPTVQLVRSARGHLVELSLELVACLRELSKLVLELHLASLGAVQPRQLRLELRARS